MFFESVTSGLGGGFVPGEACEKTHAAGPVRNFRRCLRLRRRLRRRERCRPERGARGEVGIRTGAGRRQRRHVDRGWLVGLLDVHDVLTAQHDLDELVFINRVLERLADFLLVEDVGVDEVRNQDDRTGVGGSLQGDAGCALPSAG